MPVENPHPGAILRAKLQEKGWTQDELAAITGRHRQTIASIVRGASGVSADMAVALAAAFGDRPVEWLTWMANYELAQISLSDEDQTGRAEIERRSQLHQLAPIRDMERRGWIPEATTLDELEMALEKFFGSRIDDEVAFPVATRKSDRLGDLTMAERAWCFRARQLASTMAAPPYSPARAEAIERRLRRLAAYPKEAGKLSDTLNAGGVRFVVIEPLPDTRIDGAAFWLSEEAPVIAVSARFDRIDAFWFTVMHEMAHIKHGDMLSADTNLLSEGAGGITVLRPGNDSERRANEAASNTLVPTEEMESFIRRLRPYYSADRIVQFANKIRMHPGVIVGQLQHRGEIGYSALRDYLVKIRSIVTATALTDGWGQTISPGVV